MPAGRLADCYGRKRLFLVGVALFTLASALCGWAVSARALIGFRVLHAAGAALLMPASLARILAVFPREKRSIAVSLCVFAGASARCRTFPASSCGSVTWVPWRWVWSSPVTGVGRARRLRAPSLPGWPRSLASPCGPLESKRQRSTDQHPAREQPLPAPMRAGQSGGGRSEMTHHPSWPLVVVITAESTLSINGGTAAAARTPSM
jgi:MFS family permease